MFSNIHVDDEGKESKTTLVAQKLVDYKVAGVIGHLNSGTTIPASKIYHDEGIPQISPSATNVNYTNQGFPAAFRVMANDKQQGSALANFAINDISASKIAVIDDRTAYGKGLADIFEDTVKGLGGFISLSIIISASGIENASISGISDLALGLEPLFGKFAKYFLAVGLFSAGITSTITAPMAASYVVCGCFGWVPNLKSVHFRITWVFMILCGVIISALGLKLIRVIEFAQIANGILLPIIVIILLWMMNKSSILGNFKYNIYQNIVGSALVIISLFLSFRTVLILFN